MQAMEQYWLAHAAFVAGDTISMADLPIACELEQLHMLVGAEVRPSPEYHAYLLLACIITLHAQAGGQGNVCSVSSSCMQQECRARPCPVAMQACCRHAGACTKCFGLAEPQGPSMDAQLADFPGVRGWMQRVAAELQPHWADVNAMLYKASAAAQRRRERQPQQQAKL